MEHLAASRDARERALGNADYVASGIIVQQVDPALVVGIDAYAAKARAYDARYTEE